MGDDLFTLDTVRDFILSRGGKITNHELVTHFKGFLNDPRQKGTNRGKFKDYVNTLATVKLDETGEKVLVLKKRFRDGAPVHSTPAQSTPQKVLDRPKRNKDPSVLQRAPTLVTDSVEEPSPIPQRPPIKKVHESVGSTDQDDVPVEAAAAAAAVSSDDLGLSETTDNEASAFTVGGISQDLLSSPEAEPEKVEEPEPEPEPEASQREPSPPAAAPAEEPMQVVEEPIAAEPKTPAPEPVTEPIPDTVPPPAAPREPTPPVEEPVEPEEVTVASTVPAVSEEVTNLAVPPVPATPSSSRGSSVSPDEEQGSQSAEKSRQSMSVKERARHINKIQSEGDLHSVTKKHKDKRKDRGGGEKDDDSVSSVAMTLDPTEREWVLKSAAADYHPMAKLLLTHPNLAKRKDFITTALHWAAKHGKMEVVKLLCGTPGIQVNCRSGYTALHLAAMHGHEHIIELLLQVYGADPNIRDFSGKKAKQYLRNSASSRTHQLLTVRRTNANPAPFRRVGSYSSKIQKAGYFGIGSGSAVRNSWASNASDSASEKDRSSPSPSPSPRESPRQPRKGSLKDNELMPPPPTGAGARKKKNKRGKESGTSSDSELPRRGSNSDLPGIPPSKSMFI